MLRAWLAERVLAAHHRGDVRAVIGRGGELFGPGVESFLGRNLFAAALRGRTARWLGRLAQPLTPLLVDDDFARGLITLGERAEAHGRVWHVPLPGPVTGHEFVETIFREAGTRARVSAHGSRWTRISLRASGERRRRRPAGGLSGARSRRAQGLGHVGPGLPPQRPRLRLPAQVRHPRRQVADVRARVHPRRLHRPAQHVQ